MRGRGPNKNAGDKAPAFPFVQVAVSGLLIVVEATLARFIITLAARPVGRTLVTTCRPADFAATATTTVETATAAAGRRTAGEVGTPIAHRAAVATAAGASAAVTTAATAAAVTAAATTVAAATTAAAIATATAATVAAATTASAVGRTRTTRTEATALATATAAAAAESAAAATTWLTFNGFAHGDRSTIEQRAVHGLHGRGALIICFHLEEGEATAAAGLAIHDHF